MIEGPERRVGNAQRRMIGGAGESPEISLIKAGERRGGWENAARIGDCRGIVRRGIEKR